MRVNYIFLILISIFILSFTVLLIMVNFQKASFLNSYLIVILYYIVIAFLIILVVWRLSKSKYEVLLIVLLVGLTGYSALFSSMMRNLSWTLFTSDPSLLLEGIIITSMSILNPLSGIILILKISKRRILEPLQKVIKRKNEVVTELRNQKRELSMFNRIIAHDIKDNLSNIKGYSQLYLKNDKREQYKIIERQIKQIQDLLERSLKLANAGKIIDEMEPVDLNKLIAIIVRDTIPNYIETSLQTIPIVYGDKQKLKQAFANILKNAGIHGRPKRIKVTSNFAEQKLIIKISNDGSKIANEIIENFTSQAYMAELKKSHLGLKIIKRIINAHGWEINIKNCPKTTYIVHIPRKYCMNQSNNLK